MALHVHGSDGRELTEQLSVRPMFSRSGEAMSVPKHRLPAGAMDPTTAYQIVHDHLMLDGNARLNLATFVTTWMEPEADRLMAECLDKNMIDKDEYPQTAELEAALRQHSRELWNAPGTALSRGRLLDDRLERGRMFAGLALKRRWQQRRRAAGADRPSQPGDGNQRPGLLGQVLQLLRGRAAPRTDGTASGSTSTPSRPSRLCDENTIGVVAVLGSTFDGSYEPVAEIAAALDDLQSRTGLDVPVHVDGASGGMVAPFLDPDLRLGLPPAAGRLDQHLRAQVRAGLPGCRLGRSGATPSALPEELVFKVNYLGGDMPTFALNFSRPGATGGGAVLHLPAARPGRLTGRSSRRAATWPPHVRADRGRSGRSGCSPRATSCRSSRSPLHDDVTNYDVFDVSAAAAGAWLAGARVHLPGEPGGPRCVADRGA